MAYKGIKILELMAFARNYNNALADLCIKNINQNCSNVVDFGSGMGTIAKIIQNRGFDVQCIENDELLYSALKNSGFNVSKDISSYPDSSIKNMVSFNVFEHIEDDKKSLIEINKKLSQNAKFFLFLPAYSLLYSAFDENLGHYRRYDKKNLITLLDECGYKIENTFYFDCLGFLFAFVYKFINKKGTFKSSYINLYDKFIFPLSKISDRFFRNIFGKNIVLILTKK